MSVDRQPVTISFLASHGGSSARGIIAAMRSGEIPAVPGVLITNNSDSAILSWCRQHSMPMQVINAKTHPDPKEEDKAILTALQNAGSDWVVLSGYMKKIGADTLANFQGRLLNIHPSLLPKFGGQGMYGDFVHAAVLKAGEKVSGATVHLVTGDYDEGPVLQQTQVPVLPDDSVATLRARVQGMESGLYIAAIKQLLAEPAAGNLSMA
ncbi:MAG: phosphoribosylglycinamide formyltransferase [Methylobacter sp.]|nr:MAG: phosphoribosylglycinamide formyltransferase [Methylobacter sp.]